MKFINNATALDGVVISAHTSSANNPPPYAATRLNVSLTATWLLVGEDWHRWDGGTTRLLEALHSAHLFTIGEFLELNFDYLESWSDFDEPQEYQMFNNLPAFSIYL